MAHERPDRDRHGHPVDPHRPMGLELDAVDKAEEIRAEEDEFHERLPLPFKILDTLVKSLMVLLLVLLLFAVGANVFGRFVLNQSLPATSELARFLFIWVIFLGAALAHLHREHIAVTLFVERMPRRVQRWFVVLQELIILTVVVALLVSAYEVLTTQPGTSPLLGVPLWLITISVPVSAALMGVISLYRIARAIASPASAEPAGIAATGHAEHHRPGAAGETARDDEAGQR